MSDIRAALEGAFDEHEEEEEEADEPAATGAEAPASEAVAPAVEPTGPAIDAEAEKPAAGPTDAAPAAPPTDDSPPPVGWKPVAKEHWKSLPPDVRAEVARREKETSTALTQSAGARKFAEQFHDTIRPYEQVLRMRGATPLEAIDAVMRPAMMLQLGNASQKTQVVVDLIRDYGIDLRMLDSALAGQPLPEKDDPVGRVLDERLAPVMDFIHEVQGSRQRAQQESHAQIGQTLQQFAADKANEFFEDVRDDMADLLEIAAQRGQQMTLKQAYDRAVRMNDGVQQALAQRKAQSADRKRSAGSSLRDSALQGGGKAAPADIRGALLDAWDGQR